VRGGEAAVVFDGRWLSIGGPGRTTELLLRGLAQAPPPGRWVLWGPPALERFAWPGSEVVPLAVDPRVLLGQRNALDLPRGRLTVFLHQQRPLRRVPAVNVVYDTIALRYGANPAVRRARRRFLRWVASTSRHVLTISEHSKASIVRDLGVAPARVDVLRFPFDEALADRVADLRRALPRTDAALFVGNFLPHKNLPRLLEAFQTTRFRRDGGRLVLAGGGSERWARELAERLTPAQRRFTTVHRMCSEAQLHELYATSLFLVQPSLEEGFGLPAWEALCCGLPVCASDGGSLPEVVAGYAEPFPAASTSAMTAAIDDCATRARAQTSDDRTRQTDQLRAAAPTVGQLGDHFRTVVERALAVPG
jgi:glycosyltransferase involved in cell wall biosynthesis